MSDYKTITIPGPRSPEEVFKDPPKFGPAAPDLAEYVDALKLALRQVLLQPSSVSPIELARLLASDPRNPERLEARARHDSFVAALKSESPQDTITPTPVTGAEFVDGIHKAIPDAFEDVTEPLYDEDSWK